ncbi:MAG: TIGR04086 family membrane protein [Clostridia bacterium]
MRSKVKKQSAVFIVIKAALIASIVSIVLIVLFAVLLYNGILNEGSISVVNTIIKVLGAALAAFLTVRKVEEKRFIMGAISGISYTVLAFLVFSLMSTKFSISLGLLSDLGMGLLAGMLTGLLYQTLKRT